MNFDSYYDPPEQPEPAAAARAGARKEIPMSEPMTTTPAARPTDAALPTPGDCAKCAQTEQEKAALLEACEVAVTFLNSGAPRLAAEVLYAAIAAATAHEGESNG